MLIRSVRRDDTRMRGVKNHERQTIIYHTVLSEANSTMHNKNKYVSDHFLADGAFRGDRWWVIFEGLLGLLVLVVLVFVASCKANCCRHSG